MEASNKKSKHIKNLKNRSVYNEFSHFKGFYQYYPSWRFSNADKEMWAFTSEHIPNLWDEIMPFLIGLEKRTWSDILGGKQNHPITIDKLNKCAINRINEREIETDVVISLRLNGTHRLYGYMDDNVFNIIWYDDNHGDNDTCVCKSSKKHT